MDFDEKERGKEKDLSASSSTVSLTSGSVTSAGETSSMGDMDDSVSSPTTESEWSGPVVRDKKDGRRSNGSSSRSLRSTGPSFNGSNSSRGSRAPSPSSFKYPTLYEPSPAAVPYDLSQAPVQTPGYGNPYMYPYPQPTPPTPNYIPPYHYYAPYPYPHPQTSLQNADPGSPSSQADVYPSQQPPQHQHHGVYVPYPWHSPPPTHPPTQHRPLTAPSPPVAPPASQYSTYTPPVPPYGPYPVPYYPSPPMHPMQATSPPVQNQSHYPPDYHSAHDPYAASHPFPGVIGQQSPTMGPKPRGAPPARSAWSYGPGIGMGGFGVNGNAGRPGGGGEVVGPRLSSTVRRHPGNPNGNAGARTPSDEASSPAVSRFSRFHHVVQYILRQIDSPNLYLPRHLLLRRLHGERTRQRHHNTLFLRDLIGLSDLSPSLLCTLPIGIMNTLQTLETCPLPVTMYHGRSKSHLRFSRQTFRRSR